MKRTPFIAFREGYRYSNLFGEYRVVQQLLEGKFLAEYFSGEREGETQVLTESIQQRIVENQIVRSLPLSLLSRKPRRQRVSEQLCVRVWHERDRAEHELTPELVRTMGFLAVRGYVIARVPDIYFDDFRTRYEETARALAPKPGTEGLTVSVAADRQAKWALSLGIRFRATDKELGELDFQDLRPVRDEVADAHVLYSNSLLRVFIEHGFLLGQQQFLDRITERLPTALHSAFAEGVVLAEGV